MSFQRLNRLPPTIHSTLRTVRAFPRRSSDGPELAPASAPAVAIHSPSTSGASTAPATRHIPGMKFNAFVARLTGHSIVVMHSRAHLWCIHCYVNFKTLDAPNQNNPPVLPFVGHSYLSKVLNQTLNADCTDALRRRRPHLRRLPLPGLPRVQDLRLGRRLHRCSDLAQVRNNSDGKKINAPLCYKLFLLKREKPISAFYSSPRPLSCIRTFATILQCKWLQEVNCFSKIES